MAVVAELRYVDNQGGVVTAAVAPEGCTIGRAPSCNVSIEDETISREHARLQREANGRFMLRDLGSRNKTFVNGQTITETVVVSGDVIRVGDRVLEFMEDGTAAGAGADRADLDFLTPDRTEPAGCEWIKTKAPLPLSVAQLERLSVLCTHPSLTARPEDIADTALARLVVEFQADRGFVALRGEAKREMKLVAQRALKRSASGPLMPVSQSFVFAALLQHVAGRYPQSASHIDAKTGYAATAVAAPLTHQGEPVGVVYLDRPASRKPFTAAATTQLAAAGAMIGAGMAEATRRLAQTAAREGAAWMATLRRMQTALSSPVTSGEVIAAAAQCVPGRSRCGDLADVIHLDERRCAVLITDGGGAGALGLAQAACVHAAVRVALAAAEDALLDPAELIGSVNAVTAQRGGSRPLPATYVGVDLTAGRLAYINAGGMSPLLMVAPGRLVTLDQSALILGVDPQHGYEPTFVDLPDRFRLVCYTDGLVEASPGAGGAFSDQRLHDLLLDKDAFVEPERLVAHVAAALNAHLAGAAADDDATIVALASG